MPAAKLPNEIERNQTPIISPARRCGASFVVVLRPTGYKQISPMVCSTYTPTSHHGPTLTPPAVRSEAVANTAAPSPTNSNPSENFAGLDGCRSPIFSQSHAKTGARMTTGIVGTDRNHPAESSRPDTKRLVKSRAKRLKLDPACS